MKQLLITLVLASGIAQAAEYKQFYLNEAGKQIDTVEATLAASKGDVIYNCQAQELRVGKTGKTLSLVNVKRPKKD